MSGECLHSAVNRKLDLAIQLLEDARQYIDKGDVDFAIRQIQCATALLKEAGKLVSF